MRLCQQTPLTPEVLFLGVWIASRARFVPSTNRGSALRRLSAACASLSVFLMHPQLVRPLGPTLDAGASISFPQSQRHTQITLPPWLLCLILSVGRTAVKLPRRSPVMSTLRLSDCRQPQDFHLPSVKCPVGKSIVRPQSHTQCHHCCLGYFSPRGAKPATRRRPKRWPIRL